MACHCNGMVLPVLFLHLLSCGNLHSNRQLLQQVKHQQQCQLHLHLLCLHHPLLHRNRPPLTQVASVASSFCERSSLCCTLLSIKVLSFLAKQLNESIRLCSYQEMAIITMLLVMLEGEIVFNRLEFQAICRSYLYTKFKV